MKQLSSPVTAIETNSASPGHTEELWVCGHTKKCGWKGKKEEILHVPIPAKSKLFVKGLNASQSSCPKCGNHEFYVRPVATNLKQN